MAKPDGTEAAALHRTVEAGGRSVEEAVSYAVGHRIRIEILAMLHDEPASATQLAKLVRQPLSNVTHHVEELLKARSIAIDHTEQVGNVTQNFYRVVELPFYSDDDAAALGADERQVLAGIVLQAVAAEALASLWAGKLHSDPRVMLAWKRMGLDEQGREELADEQNRSWARMMEIEAESAKRRAASGDPGRSYVVTSLGYERSRAEAAEAADSGKPADPERG